MAVRAYRTRPYETTHENRAFDSLLSALEENWGEKEELVVLLGNLYCQGSEIDAAIIKSRSITVIDFKDYGGKVRFSENGSWFADDIEVKGGSKGNPYQQIRTNKFALLEFLENRLDLPSGRSPNFGHISGMVLFQRPIIFDDRHLPGPISPWFHVVDMEHAMLRLAHLTSREIDLTNDDIEAIVTSIGINQYTPAGAGVRLARESSDDVASIDQILLAPLNVPWEQISKFLARHDSLAIISGMVGTGKRLLLESLVSEAQNSGRNYTVLSPNRRLADQCSVEARSIYGHIFSGNSRYVEERMLYDLKDNEDDSRHLYIVDNAHLISDSFFETEISRYGSGQLLSDFIEFLELKETRRQVVFFGDPYQLGRGNFNECALSVSKLKALSEYEPIDIQLDHVLPGNDDDIFVKNCIKIANNIRLKTFNELEILTNETTCVAAPEDDSEKRDLIKKMFLDSPEAPKYVAFSHAQVNQFNKWIRKIVYGRDSNLCKGDVVHIHNGFFIPSDDGIEPPYHIQNDCFAEILDVDKNSPPLVQSLRGREKPIEVPFLRVRARILHNEREHSFLCLSGYLYSEKPELDRDTLLALRVSAKTRFRQKYGETIHDQSTEIDAPNSSDKIRNPDFDRLAGFMEKDSFLNAAQLRFGYGLTVHRAQGQNFSKIVANLCTGHAQTNESYFRWLYTLFALSKKKIVLSNIPQISVFSYAKWDESRARFDDVRSTDLIQFDPNIVPLDDSSANFEFPERELEALYQYIAKSLSNIGVTIRAVEHHQYQEVYDLDVQERTSCCLRLHYKKGFKISKIEVVNSPSPDMRKRIRAALISNIVFSNDFQRRVYEYIRDRLAKYAIEVKSIERGSYKEIYIIDNEEGRAKLEINFNKKQFVTVISLLAYSDQRMKDKIRKSLGV